MTPKPSGGIAVRLTRDTPSPRTAGRVRACRQGLSFVTGVGGHPGVLVVAVLDAGALRVLLAATALLAFIWAAVAFINPAWGPLPSRTVGASALVTGIEFFVASGTGGLTVAREPHETGEQGRARCAAALRLVSRFECEPQAVGRAARRSRGRALRHPGNPRSRIGSARARAVALRGRSGGERHRSSRARSFRGPQAVGAAGPVAGEPARRGLASAWTGVSRLASAAGHHGPVSSRAVLSECGSTAAATWRSSSRCLPAQPGGNCCAGR